MRFAFGNESRALLVQYERLLHEFDLTKLFVVIHKKLWDNYNSFCIFIIGFASFSQKPLLKFIYEYELSRNI